MVHCHDDASFAASKFITDEVSEPTVEQIYIVKQQLVF